MMAHQDDQRKQIADFITHFIKTNGYCPTIREIGIGVGIKSTSQVHGQLVYMADRGQVLMGVRSGRTIRINPEWNRNRDTHE